MHDLWAIGYRPGSFSPDWTDFDWLHPPAGRIYADPFLAIHQGEPWVFFEDYDGRRGHIAASPLRTPEVRPVLQLDWHLSYPYLIQHGGELFCVPEQHQANQVSLYRCLEFPHRWIFEAVLLDGFAGVDPTVIWSDGKWWMWVGHQQRRARDNTFLFWAEQLTGPWREHRRSPAICRTDLARPAGMPWQTPDGWMRPSQNRTRTYGGGIVVYRVSSWDEDEYQESECWRWEPNPAWPYPDGLHHVCSLEGWTCWDAKRLVKEL